MLGGKENLKRAISRGAVKVYKKTDSLIEAYAMPAKSVSYNPEMETQWEWALKDVFGMGWVCERYSSF